MTGDIAVKGHENEPFPARQLITLGLCRLAEPVAFISIVSYNFVMVKEIKGPDNASFWAGVLVSAFAIAEASTAVLWGTLSDKIGRKPIILIGLTGTVISSLMLGFAKNYWVALLARLIGGGLNGNVAVMQTMVAEIVKNPKHEPRAYSIQPFAWSLGSIAGSALGGYASQPARFYPEIFPPDGLFGKYPYLLPNLVAAGCIVLAIFNALFFLKETNPRFQKDGNDSRMAKAPNDSIIETEQTPLLAAQSEDFKPQEHRCPSFVAGSIPSFEDSAIDMRRASAASVPVYQPDSKVDATSQVQALDEDTESISSSSIVTKEKIFTKPVIMWIFAIALMCYHQMAFVSVFPIYVLDTPSTDHGLDLKGGLGLTVHDVGRYMAVNSFLSLFIQAFVLPFFLTKVGIWKSICIFTVFAPCVDVIWPFISALPYAQYAVYPAFIMTAFCNIIIYPAMLIMLKDCVPDKKLLGKVNGLAVTASSAARTIAPPLIGLFYTGFGSAGAWWSCAVFGLIAVFELFFIPRIKSQQANEDAESA